MSRTRRAVPYKHYWGSTKAEKKKWWEEELENPSRWGHMANWYEREYLLHGTDSKNYSRSTHYYFNVVNRIGRRIARDQLRPHVVLGENFEFNDSRYIMRYKGVWWDID